LGQSAWLLLDTNEAQRTAAVANLHALFTALQTPDGVVVERELPSAKLSGQAGRALSAQAACTADTKRHWRCSGGDGNTWSEVRDESWSTWSERAPVCSVAVVVVVISEPLTVVALESVGSNRRGTRGYSAA
jgi:hypothetical protein